MRHGGIDESLRGGLSHRVWVFSKEKRIAGRGRYSFGCIRSYNRQFIVGHGLITRGVVPGVTRPEEVRADDYSDDDDPYRNRY